MLLGKRQRPPIKRTMSLSEIKFDLNSPTQPDPSDHHDQSQIPSSSRKQLLTVDEHRQVHHGRGDRAFCSLECRQQEIRVDERKKKIPVGSTVVVSGAVKGERVSAAV
ncbi:unnamed protein product [Arabis nemorensis]|uniref:FLZ-type domain-containing protein n=1 Tax=Arabis nemorensis TaxID=586526 RepID=A0A565ASZ0_9BRAS|nr:unnamed protein product [Arabis nemorensis]